MNSLSARRRLDDVFCLATNLRFRIVFAFLKYTHLARLPAQFKAMTREPRWYRQATGVDHVNLTRDGQLII